MNSEDLQRVLSERLESIEELLDSAKARGEGYGRTVFIGFQLLQIVQLAGMASGAMRIVDPSCPDPEGVFIARYASIMASVTTLAGLDERQTKEAMNHIRALSERAQVSMQDSPPPR